MHLDESVSVEVERVESGILCSSSIDKNGMSMSTLVLSGLVISTVTSWRFCW
jgi:hypothetical protein